MSSGLSGLWTENVGLYRKITFQAFDGGAADHEQTLTLRTVTNSNFEKLKEQGLGKGIRIQEHLSNHLMGFQ